jgi:HEAT repeat protein
MHTWTQWAIGLAGLAAFATLLCWAARAGTARAYGQAIAMMSDEKPRTRLRGVEVLNRLSRRRFPRAFESLDRATEDRDEGVRRAAHAHVNDLGRAMGVLPATPISDQDELDRLKTQLLSSSPAIREEAATQLRSRGDPWLFQAGVQLRADARKGGPGAELAAVRALGCLGDPLHGSYLLLLLGSPDPELTREAVVAAGKTKAWRCEPAVRELAASASDVRLRQAAKDALRAFR